VKWLDREGIDEDVVVSSRVRLARNIRDEKFPQRMSLNESQVVTEKILNAMEKSNLPEKYNFKRIEDLSSLERRAYVEEHLISPGLIEVPDKSSFFLREDEAVTIMINEEDHLRMQVLFPGLYLEEGWKLCSEIDDFLEKNIDYAYSEKFGYLTSCPTNVGTGMRISCMVHLPCLVLTGYIDSLISALNQIGLTVRGIYGEGSQILGNLFQISNQTTLGETEEEIVQKLKSVILEVIEKERNLRLKLLETQKIDMEDRVFRALGLLKYSRVITSSETMKLFSDIKMGIEMGIIKDIKLKDIDQLMILCQPSSLQRYYGKDMIPEERDIKRAELIRERF
jgi:protein arginine kinase